MEITGFGKMLQMGMEKKEKCGKQVWIKVEKCYK